VPLPSIGYPPSSPPPNLLDLQQIVSMMLKGKMKEHGLHKTRALTSSWVMQ